MENFSVGGFRLRIEVPYQIASSPPPAPPPRIAGYGGRDRWPGRLPDDPL